MNKDMPVRLQFVVALIVRLGLMAFSCNRMHPAILQCPVLHHRCDANNMHIWFLVRNSSNKCKLYIIHRRCKSDVVSSWRHRAHCFECIETQSKIRYSVYFIAIRMIEKQWHIFPMAYTLNITVVTCPFIQVVHLLLFLVIQLKQQLLPCVDHPPSTIFFSIISLNSTIAFYFINLIFLSMGSSISNGIINA